MNNVIESMKAKGFTYLGIVEGEKIFCNSESEDSIKDCLKFLEKITGEEWEAFRETSGNKNLVFYRTSMFEVYYSCIHFKGGNKIELPLNCSSCDSMFFNCNLPEGFSLGDKFDTSKIVNMQQMFFSSRLPEDFSLGDKFDVSNVKNMENMFFICYLPEDKMIDDFNSEVEVIEWLKNRSKQGTDKQGTEKLSAF